MTTTTIRPVTGTNVRAALATTLEAQLGPFRYAWDTDMSLTDAERSRLTKRLAHYILSAPLRTEVADLMVNTAGWDVEDANRADAAGEPGSQEWLDALGRHRHTTLTGDGRHYDQRGWCNCSEDAPSWVRVERWTAEGRVFHGYICPVCRRLTQTG